MTESCDVAIIGAGLVGASLALALASSGLSVALAEPRASGAPSANWDSRIYAVSPGSAAFLNRVGAWQGMDSARVARVETMRIFGDASLVSAANMEFNAYDAGLRELAFIAESGRIQAALWQCLDQAAHVTRYCPAVCVALSQHVDATDIVLNSGVTLRAKLVVGADGAQSWVREQAGIKAHTHAYAQCGVVANFACALPHHDTAYQWFRADGVLALLPLPGNRVSMVWSTSDAHAQALMALDAAALAQRVSEASHAVMGALEVITPVAAFPLQLQRVEVLVKPRLALVGDAAHNVHPLAGQGVNLGFRDARELAAVLCDRGAQHDCGDYALLRRYERARREDVLSMQLVTDGLQKLFASNAVWLSRARNLGVRLMENQPMLKNLLMKHAIA